MACLVIAHRGASAYEPENTLTAFRKAMDLVADFIELDIHLSSDKELIVIHDYTVDRTTNGSGSVNEKTVFELRSLNAGGGEWVPTLEEVVDVIGGETRLYIEIKVPEIEGKLISFLRKKDLVGDVIVASFNQSIVKKVKQLEHNVKTSILFESSPVPITSLAHSLKVDIIHPCAGNLSKNDVIKAHQENLKVITWATDDPLEMHRLISYGVDGICTNKPDVLREIVDGKKLRKNQLEQEI